MNKTSLMPDEEVFEPALVVPGSHLRIAGRFTYAPNKTYVMERLTSGTCYHAETPSAVREVLETYMNSDVRLALHYGNVETGEDWLDEYGMEGRIGRSTGRVTSPLLLPNARSTGGGAILDRCIIRIRFANRSTGGDLYRHPTYNADRDKHREHHRDPITETKSWSRRFA